MPLQAFNAPGRLDSKPKRPEIVVFHLISSHPFCCLTSQVEQEKTEKRDQQTGPAQCFTRQGVQGFQRSPQGCRESGHRHALQNEDQCERRQKIVQGQSGHGTWAVMKGL